MINVGVILWQCAPGSFIRSCGMLQHTWGQILIGAFLLFYVGFCKSHTVLDVTKFCMLTWRDVRLRILRKGYS